VLNEEVFGFASILSVEEEGGSKSLIGIRFVLEEDLEFDIVMLTLVESVF